MPDLSLGWDRRDISPRRPTALAGFAARAALPPASEVVSPLQLRTVVLRQPTATVVVVVGDLLCWGPDNMARIEHDLAERYGLTPDQLVISGTHTHSAPQPSSAFNPGLGVPDPRWVEFLHEQVVAGVGAALASVEPVTIEIGQQSYQLGVERRHIRSGGRERPAPLQQRLTVMNFRPAGHPDGRIVATLFHHACHPTLHHDNAVSADFPGAATAALERDGRDVALYLQGCCGNVNPDHYDGTAFLAGDAADIARMGEALADAVRSTATSAVAPDLMSQRRTLQLPTEQPPDTAELQRIARDRDLMTRGWAQLLLDHPERRTGAPVTVSLLRLGEDWQLLGVSGEATSPYANQVTEALGDRAITLGYCNGMLGYLVSATQLADGGYEAYDAPYWFGMPGPLTADAEGVLVEALVSLGSTAVRTPAS